MNHGRETFMQLEAQFSTLFDTLSDVQLQIHKELEAHADGKVLKGNELVGWLGEIYGKILYDGRLVDDSYEHDFETSAGLRVSVKTRKGLGRNWSRTSAIPLIEGDGCPTHLLFVHLSDRYRVRKIWMYPWADLVRQERFKSHMVRGNFRSYYFVVHEKTDQDYCVYESTT